MSAEALLCSEVQQTHTHLVATCCWAMPITVAATHAAPPMSARMAAIPAAGLMEMPPVSKVTPGRPSATHTVSARDSPRTAYELRVLPFPTSTRGMSSPPSRQRYLTSSSQGTSTEPLATDRKAPIFCDSSHERGLVYGWGRGGGRRGKVGGRPGCQRL